jgi:AcrR family transcriptional regulator
MSPRHSLAEATQTRAAIIDRAAELASLEGLEALSIGRLASELGMSKAGVIGPFGSKEALQLEVLERASEIFRSEVGRHSTDAPAGLARVRALCDGWIEHIASRTFPGGCFWTAVSCEFDDRPGPVREAIAAAIRNWGSFLRSEVELGIEAGELSAQADADQIVFELNAVAMGLNQQLQLHRDPAAVKRARAAMKRILEAFAN